MPIGLPPGGKATVTLDISYMMKGWYERSFFSVGRAETFVPVIKRC